MTKKLFNIQSVLCGLALLTVIGACNKKLEQAQPIVNSDTSTIGGFMKNGDTAVYKLFLQAAAKVTGVNGTGTMLADLLDRSKAFTVFFPDNAAMRAPNAFSATGFDSVYISKSANLAVITSVVKYHVLPTVSWVSSDIPDSFPNTQLPTALGTGTTLPGTPIPFVLSGFPSRRSPNFWYNTAPGGNVSIRVGNGVLNRITKVALPPSQVLAQMIYSDPKLTYFTAAVQRADSGQVGLNRFDSLFKYPPVNLTVLVPTDTAFQRLIRNVVSAALVSQGVPAPIADAQAASLAASPTFFSNPAFFPYVTAATVRGMLAYHILAKPVGGTFIPDLRAFSVNFIPNQFVKTLVNSQVPVHPGIMALPTFSGTTVTTLKFKSYGTWPPGGTPYSDLSDSVIVMDKHAINGVFHVLNRVMLPQ
jgi:uncharacterized surface protein with fasciclin (FAS1) repeats